MPCDIAAMCEPEYVVMNISNFSKMSSIGKSPDSILKISLSKVDGIFWPGRIFIVIDMFGFNTLNFFIAPKAVAVCGSTINFS